MSISTGDWRSLLYIPAHMSRFVEKAASRGADAIILDLEDGVPRAAKAAARDAIGSAVPAVSAEGADVLVRINRAMRDMVADIDATVRPGVRGLVVTKVDGASHLRLLDELVGELEGERGLPVGAIRFIPVIESAAAWLKMAEIFGASRRNVATILGSEDFSLECGAQPTEETLLFPKQQLIIAARACGLAPLGLISTIADFSDVDRLHAVAERSRRFGFSGATCVHPNQVVAVNAAFMPNEGEINRARRSIEAFEAALQRGEGAVALDGMMIDAPVVARARRLLERWGERATNA